MPPKVSLGFACVSHRNRLWVLFPEWIPRVINEDLQRRFEFPGDWTCRHLNDPNHPKSFKLLLHALPFKVWDTSSTRIWSCIWRLLSCTIIWIHGWSKEGTGEASTSSCVRTCRYLHFGMSQTWLHVLCLWGFEPTSANHEKACLTRNKQHGWLHLVQISAISQSS